MNRLPRFVAVLCTVLPLAALAQSFPAKPVRAVVPYEPGGAVDLAARDIAPKMAEDLGQPVVIENRGGAGGQIGAQQVVRSAADGYTIMFTVGTTLALSKFSRSDLGFDPAKDFTPIAGPVDTILCIAAGAGFPPDSLRETIEFAKKNPVSYGTTAVGGSTHLAMEEIARLTGVRMVHIPYKGGGPITVNLLGNQLQLGALPVAPVIKNVRAGKMKILAVFGSARFSQLPEVPTVNEVVPGYQHLEGGIWVLGPAGIPRAAVQRLNQAINKAVLDPSVRPKLEARGQIIAPRNAGEFDALFRKSNELAAAMAKRAGLKPE